MTVITLPLDRPRCLKNVTGSFNDDGRNAEASSASQLFVYLYCCRAGVTAGTERAAIRTLFLEIYVARRRYTTFRSRNLIAASQTVLIRESMHHIRSQDFFVMSKHVKLHKLHMFACSHARVINVTSCREVFPSETRLLSRETCEH